MIGVRISFATAVAIIAVGANVVWAAFSIGNGECNSISGNLNKGCYDCFPCDVNAPKAQNILKWSDENCNVKSLCCLLKSNSFTRKEANTTFCGGTVIGGDAGVILTLASCATKYRAEDLAVSFTRALEEAVDVKRVVVHAEYDASKPLVNNIALLVLDTEVQMAPTWVKPACRSDLPPLPGTTCVVMSDEDYFIDMIEDMIEGHQLSQGGVGFLIHKSLRSSVVEVGSVSARVAYLVLKIDTVVPLQKQCKVKSHEPHASQLCSVTLKDEYVPELGAGLFCQDERAGTSQFIVSGITLKTRGQLNIYTNVAHFNQWLSEKISAEVST